MTIRVTIDGRESVEEVVHFERGEPQAGNLGFTLLEAKIALGERATNDGGTTDFHLGCATPTLRGVRMALRGKDDHEIVMRIVFGKLNLKRARLYRCSCQGRARASFSPLAEHSPGPRR